MKKFEKILCPFDFSEFSEEALLYALKLADDETSITLLNVVQLPYIQDPYGMSFYDSKATEIEGSTKSELLDKINTLKISYPKITFEFSIQSTMDPADAILLAQKNSDFDVIVMGSHGRKGLDRLLLGSVTESVLRDATCPVLIIKHQVNKK